MFQTDATTLNAHFRTDFAPAVSATKPSEAIALSESKTLANYINGCAT